MPRFRWAIVVLAVLSTACTRGSTTPANDYVLLVPDWKNELVHRIAMDGAYEGDFLDPARKDDPKVDRTLWANPLGVLFMPGNPGSFWMTAERALASWDGNGRLVRPLFLDSQHLETPTCIVRVNDEIFVVSADRKEMLVFASDGTHLRSFGYPELYRANDCKLGPDGMIYVGSTMHAGQSGLVSVWDPTNSTPETKAVAYRVPGDSTDDATYWVQGIVFDDDKNLLLTDFSRGRLERWNLAADKRLDILLDSANPGTYLKLERGPDGFIYMAGPEGIYRFDSRATPEQLRNLRPFFDARQISLQLAEPFSPVGLAFVPRNAVGPPR